MEGLLDDNSCTSVVDLKVTSMTPYTSCFIHEENLAERNKTCLNSCG